MNLRCGHGISADKRCPHCEGVFDPPTGASTLTDEQVVRVLAERLGWSEVYYAEKYGQWMGRPPGEEMPFERCEMPDMLASRDALAPVLEGLSPEEWGRLHVRLSDDAWEDHAGVNKTDRYRAFFQTKWLLTLPARDLAHAVATVLVGSREAKHE